MVVLKKKEEEGEYNLLWLAFGEKRKERRELKGDFLEREGKKKKREKRGKKKQRGDHYWEKKENETYIIMRAGAKKK